MLLYDIIESPLHPDIQAACAHLNYRYCGFTRQRKAMAQLKREPPDIVIGDFFYGFGNNYAGANVSNLDVLLRSLQRFAPDARIVVLADRQQLPHVDKLARLFSLHAVVALPTTTDQLENALR